MSKYDNGGIVGLTDNRITNLANRLGEQSTGEERVMWEKFKAQPSPELNVSKKLKMKIEGKLDLDEDTESKIKAFTKALDELPLEINLRISVDGSENGTLLKLSMADILFEQVKEKFNKK
ncbi:hypothetical protein [Bacillus sp. AG4(2022)]|uniref:hypothetical protein n=1 Tax=Bacillus sp. AG4(2022) TaxID=2962594 RepID=UPI002882AD83|nr:hypothetical protein [Bacillus sp. AG4(2022)]MDT0160474.1 hypothetical protein [Bacillus sp. AG4(2022)]